MNGGNLLQGLQDAGPVTSNCVPCQQGQPVTMMTQQPFAIQSPPVMQPQTFSQPPPVVMSQPGGQVCFTPPRGPRGEKGEPGQSIRGPQGIQGVPGRSIKGDKGDKGDPGGDMPIVVDLVTNSGAMRGTSMAPEQVSAGGGFPGGQAHYFRFDLRTTGVGGVQGGTDIPGSSIGNGAATPATGGTPPAPSLPTSTFGDGFSQNGSGGNTSGGDGGTNGFTAGPATAPNVTIDAEINERLDALEQAVATLNDNQKLIVKQGADLPTRIEALEAVVVGLPEDMVAQFTSLKKQVESIKPVSIQPMYRADDGTLKPFKAPLTAENGVIQLPPSPVTVVAPGGTETKTQVVVGAVSKLQFNQDSQQVAK